MRVGLFKAYVRLWAEVMFAMETVIDFSSRDPAFLSERLFSLYMTAQLKLKNLTVGIVPFCLCLNWKVPNERR